MSITAPIDKATRNYTNLVVDATKVIRDSLSEAYLQVTGDRILGVTEMAQVITGSVKYALTKLAPKEKFTVSTTIDKNLTAEVTATRGKTIITMRATRQG
jgi:hypothetical protein